MRYRFDGYNWLVRLEKGEKLVESLHKIIEQENIKTGWVFGIGATDQAEIGYYDQKSKSYKWTKYDKALEILGLQGSISFDEEGPAVHLHGNFSDETMQAIGGHIKELAVSIACEIFIHDWFATGIGRKPDQQTGLKLLDL